MAESERSNIPSQFFTKEEIARISEAIATVEKNTSAEIRIRVEQNCEGDPIERAKELMPLLGINKTKNRTGVLIYIALQNHRLAVYGDEGIHSIFKNEGWAAIASELSDYFRKQQFCDGLINITSKIGQILSSSFPAEAHDINELSNEPSFGE